MYLPTTRLPQGDRRDRIVLANLAASAIDQLRSAGTEAPAIAAVEEAVAAIVDDDEFWSRQTDSLAVFISADHTITFRLPNRLTEAVEVADRFHVKPLLRAVTFPQAAYVLALAKGGGSGCWRSARTDRRRR